MLPRMSLWTRITDALSALAAGEPLSVVFDRLFAHPTPPERSVAFTIAVIALGAKIAKADGLVTRNEVMAFREVFSIPQAEEKNAARVFDLARQDVAGFDAYARKIRAMFDGDSHILTDLLEGLFYISMADGQHHPHEEHFLAEVAQILQIDGRTLRAIQARHVPDVEADPFTVLGIAEDSSRDEARAAWKAMVRDNHPDVLMARGVPPEGLKLAAKRLIAINAAWATIAAATSDA
jgi:DnaJ like chaperone protein